MSEIYERSRNAELFEQTESTERLESQMVQASDQTAQQCAGELQASTETGTGSGGEPKPTALKCCLQCDAVLGASCVRRTIQNDLRAYLPPADLAALSAQFELGFCNLTCYNRFCATLVQQRPPAMVAFLRARLQGKPFAFEAQDVKRHKGTKWRQYDASFVPKREPPAPPAAAPASSSTCVESKQTSVEAVSLQNVALRSSRVDNRQCEFCEEKGDGETNGPGRLLNLDLDKWVHLNCALWSDEVYETQNGSLVNVEQALRRALELQCVHCHKPGASLSCFVHKCPNRYHVACAQRAECLFHTDKTLLCNPHRATTPTEPGLHLFDLSVFRRVYINRDETAQVANAMRFEDNRYAVRVGALVLMNPGQLLPHQVSFTLHVQIFIYMYVCVLCNSDCCFYNPYSECI